MSEKHDPTSVVPPEVVDNVNRLVREVAAGAQQIRPALEQMARLALPHIAAIRSTLANFAPTAEAVRQNLERARPMLIAISAAIERLPEQQAAALRILASNGWYLDPDGMTAHDIFGWAADFQAGKIEETHCALCAHFQSRLTDIEAALSEQFPRRAKFFRSACDAHRRGDYIASVAIWLIQSDGLCFDRTGEQLFGKNNGKMRIAGQLKNGKSPLTVSALTALIEPTPISAGRSDRQTLVNYLNRREVLHGESLDYGNELNGCRAISLVTYVAWALWEVE